MIPLIILFGCAVLIGIALLVYAKKPTKQKNFTVEKHLDINKIYYIKDVYEGVIHTGDEYLMLAKIEGVNFTVLSAEEQNSKESAMIEIFTQLAHPVRFISSVIVADMIAASERVSGIADTTTEGNLRTYREMYAEQLRKMREERQVLTQSIHLAVPGKSKEEAQERLFFLEVLLREKAGLVVTPVSTTDEVYSILQDIFMPDKIVSPAEIAITGVTSAVHFSAKEVEAYLESIA